MTARTKTHAVLYHPTQPGARLTRLLFLLLMSISTWALADPPKPPKTVQVTRDDGSTVTITVSDADGNGKWDTTVIVERNLKGEITRRDTDKDTDEDGKAEESTTEAFANPGDNAKPSHKVTRTRRTGDRGWRNVEESTDADQDGNPEERKESNASQGDGNMDSTQTHTDANDNGTVEKTERKLADPGDKKYRTLEVIRNDDTTGEESSRTRTEGDFGPTLQQQDNIRMPNVDEARNGLDRREGAAISEHLGDVLVSAQGRLAIDALLVLALGPTPGTPPFDDAAILARLVTPWYTPTAPGILVNQGGLDTRLIARDGSVLLRGVMTHLQLIGPLGIGGALDPASDAALTGAFLLSTLRLAGVDPSSPFYDANLSDLDSPFVLDIAALLDPIGNAFLPNAQLVLRFNAFDSPVIAEPGNSSGFGTLTVKVEEPATLTLLAALCAWLMRSRRESRRGPTPAGPPQLDSANPT